MPSRVSDPTLSESELYDLVFGKVVQHLRESAQLSQLDAATAVGMNQSGWSRLEAGKLKLGPFETAKVAGLFGLSTDDLHKKVEAAREALHKSGVAVVPQARQADEWWVVLLKFVGIVGLAGLAVFAVAAVLGSGTGKGGKPNPPGR